VTETKKAKETITQEVTTTFKWGKIALVIKVIIESQYYKGAYGTTLLHTGG
jgi:hypothetical protein